MEPEPANLDDVARRRGYCCAPLSWDGLPSGGDLLCCPNNVSDVHIREKTGKQLYTLRSIHFNDRLGWVNATDVAFVVGNHRYDCVTTDMSPATLRNYLKHFRIYGGYSGVKTPNLYAEGTDNVARIRFQTVFIPVESDLAKSEFCTEVFNCNTGDVPSNLLVLTSLFGSSVELDSKKVKTMFAHHRDPKERTYRHWMPTIPTDRKIGGNQFETGDVEIAIRRGARAPLIRMGIPAMGIRYNVQILAQVPLKPIPVPQQTSGGRQRAAGLPVRPPWTWEGGSGPPGAVPRRPLDFKKGVLVARGAEVERWEGVSYPFVERDPSQHITLTLTVCYTVTGDVPSEADVSAAIDDLQWLYTSCALDRDLAEAIEITAPLTQSQKVDVRQKIAEQHGLKSPLVPFILDDDLYDD